MKINILKIAACFSIFTMLENSYGSIVQILDENFFQNPAELGVIKNLKVTSGNLFIRPTYQFTGVSYGSHGTISSDVYNNLPYLLAAYRPSEAFVFGFDAVPSTYGRIDWSSHSFASEASTSTYALYYRFGFQSSYSVNEDLMLGAGFNIEDNAINQLNFFVPGQGNEINQISGVNYSGDFGLYYRVNAKNYLTLAGYTQVKTYGQGTSVAGTFINDHFKSNIIQAPVIYVGIQHIEPDAWSLEGKLYWSGWSIYNTLNLINTTIGTYILPINWKNVLSFQATAKYKLTEKFGLLASGIYETNPAILATNALGYPLAASGALTGGGNFFISNTLSVEASYTYGGFLPNAPIKNATTQGTVNSHFQIGRLQIVYHV